MRLASTFFIPPMPTGNPNRVEFKKTLVETAKGAVQLAAVALDVAASATQNVPYLGAISKVLVEISKIADEVNVCKYTWKIVTSKVQRIQTIIDNFCDHCNREGRSVEDELPDVIKRAFKDFEACLLKVIVTMNDCKTTAKLRLIYKRAELTAAANRCDREITSALSIFQAQLQIDQWNLQREQWNFQRDQWHSQRDQGKMIHDIQKAVIPHIKPLVSLKTHYSPAHVLPPAPAIFFGRSGEVDQVVNLILNHGPACAAIVGAGGIGKTSIALASIHHPDVQKQFLHQRFFLPCEAIFTANSLAVELLKLFGFSGDPDKSRSSSDTLVLYVQAMTSKCLLCLDNFETPWDSDKHQVESLLVSIAAVHHLTLIITSRDSDHPRGIRWGALRPIQPLALDAAIATWDAISHSHDNFSILLIKAVECIPLAVTLLAQLVTTESSEALWASWNSKLIKLVRLDESAHRLNNLELSIQLSLQSPRLRACSGALDFLIVLCMLPQGMPVMRIPVFESAFGKDFTGLHSAISVLKQCSLAYLLDGSLCVLSPIRLYTQSHHELSTPLTRVLFLKMAEVYLNLIPTDSDTTPSVVKDIHLEIGNISAVLNMCLTDNHWQPVLEKTINLSKVYRVLGIYDTGLLLKATSIAHAFNPSLEGNCYFEQGVTYNRFGRLPDAEQAFQSALDLHKEVHDRLGQANDLQGLGELFTRLNRLEDGERALQSALNLHKEVNDRVGQANDLKGLGGLYTRLNRLKDAKETLQSALDLHKEVGDKVGQANDLRELGEMYRKVNRLEDAERALQSALKLDKEVGSSLGQGNDLYRLGKLYQRLDRFEDAECSLRSALDLHKETEDKLGQAGDLAGLGELYSILDRLQDAEGALQSALDLHKEVESRLGQANALQGLGELYVRFNQIEDAEQPLQAALDLYRELNSRLGQANALQGLGALYITFDRLEDAERALQSALDLYKEVDSRLGQANALQERGKLYKRLDRLEDAEQAFQSAIHLHKEVQDRISQANDLRGLGGVFIRLHRFGDAERALQSALNLHKEVADRLGQADDLKQLAHIYARLSRLEDAEQALQSALRLHKEVDSRLGQANDLKRLGELYIRLNRLADAERALESALNLHKEIDDNLGHTHHLQDLNELFGLLREKQKRDAHGA